MNNLFTANWGDLPPPKNTKVSDIISNLPFRYMAWMEGSEWPIYMTFIDHMSDTCPIHIDNRPDFTSSHLNFGAGIGNYSQVPTGPTEANNVQRSK